MWSPWYILKDKTSSTGFVVKRSDRINGKTKWQSLPAGEYKHLPLPEVESLVRRLNLPLELKRKEAEQRYNFDHTFINQHAKERFKIFMESRANDKNHIHTTMRYLDLYVLEFYILKKKLPDPQFWHKHEHDWGLWLLNEQKLSASTIKQVSQIANRFLVFVSTKLYPEKLTVMTLEPLGRNKLKKLKARGNFLERYKFISEGLFKEIVTKLEVEKNLVLPNIKLAYFFGLRIAESYGVNEKKFFSDALLVNEQAVGFRNNRLSFGDLKTLDQRKVPYWYCSPQEAYKLVKALQPMHPDTLNEKVNKALKPFGRQSHDLRRSFITRALREHNHRDVQLAAGHKDIRTTLSYAQDDRELSTKQLSLEELEN